MAKKKQDLFHHEVLDRTCILADAFYTWLVQHPFIIGNGKLHKKAEQIGDLLGELYQDIGNTECKKITKKKEK
jgi:hypothetical protein